MLVGGYALAANGIARATEDIDLLLSIKSAADGRKLLHVLSQIPDSGITIDSDLGCIMPTGEKPDVIRLTADYVVDLMYDCCGKTYENMLPFLTCSTMNGVDVFHVNLDGLLELKQGIRSKDIADRTLIQRAIAMLNENERNSGTMEPA